jgi:hypothetical protein
VALAFNRIEFFTHFPGCAEHRAVALQQLFPGGEFDIFAHDVFSP